MKTEHHITVLFDPPFWIILFERIENNQHSYAKEVIGTSEPSYVEILDFLENIDLISLKYTLPTPIYKNKSEKINFKKRQRLIKRFSQENAVKHTYTKAQTMLKLQYDADKEERKALSKSNLSERKERNFALKQEKKKQKRRGH